MEELSELPSNEKLDHLMFSYQEVLDATKHQDDKIGRLLTAIAFLVASSFAMANLAQSHWLTTAFKFGSGGSIRLPLLSLLAFFLGVVITILLLMSSFATPLKFPNAKSQSKQDKSTFFFNEVGNHTSDEWNAIWEKEDDELILHKYHALIHETLNLAQRTKIKYNRLTEAVSIFSLSLLAYAISIVCVILAAVKNSPADGMGQPIVVGFHTRVILTIILFVFMLIQLHATHQSNNNSVSVSTSQRKRNHIFLGYGVAILCAIVLLGLFPNSHGCRLVLAGLLSVCLLIYVRCGWNANYLAREDEKKTLRTKYIVGRSPKDFINPLKKNRLQSFWKRQEYEIQMFLRRFLYLVVSSILFLLGIIVVYLYDSFRIRFLVLILIVVAVTLRSGFQPQIYTWSNRKWQKYKDDHDIKIQR